MTEHPPLHPVAVSRLSRLPARDRRLAEANMRRSTTLRARAALPKEPTPVLTGPLDAAQDAARFEILDALRRLAEFAPEKGIGRARLAGGMCPTFARFPAPQRLALLNRLVADRTVDLLPRGPNEYGSRTAAYALPKREAA
jgi:hypothetical protein